MSPSKSFLKPTLRQILFNSSDTLSKVDLLTLIGYF